MMIHVKKIVFLKHLSELLLLEDTVAWVLFTLTTICFTKANLGETLSSRSRTVLSPNVPLTWCKSSYLAHSWTLNQSQLTGIDRNVCNLPSFVDWLVASNSWLITLMYKHRKDYFKVLYPRPAEKFKTSGQWTNKIATLQLFQSFSH